MDKFPESPKYLPPNSGTVRDLEDVDYECKHEDYPSPSQIKEVLQANNITLLILTPNDDSKVTGAWKWVNENLLGQPADFYQFIRNDSSDILEGVLKVIKAATRTSCTTTHMPSSSTQAVTGDVSNPSSKPCHHKPKPCKGGYKKCNQGVFVKISNRPKEVNLTVVNG